MDVIPFISKDTSFPVITQKDLDQKYNGDWSQYLGNGPYVHDYLKEMNKEVLNKYDCMSVAEGAGVTTQTAHNFVDEDRKELSMLYHFDGVNYNYQPGKFKTPFPGRYPLPGFKAIYSKWDSVFAEKGWGTIYLGNHDQPRMLTRWGNDHPKFRNASSKLLTTFLLSMRATPYYYFGDELGMSNIKFDSIQQYKDIESIGMYQQIKNRGGNLKEFMDAQKISARDNGRTPMQWNNKQHAGFTTGQPWLPVNDNHVSVNVEAMDKDSGSILNYFRKMIRLRKSSPVLIYGKYTLLDKDNPNVYAYLRELNGEKILVLLNFSDEESSFRIPDGMKAGEVMISNYEKQTSTSDKEIKLIPWQAIIFKLQK
jgi:oligo-1,6-glucosidase